MNNETRMNKYKELREKVREELDVELKKAEIDTEEDDYLSFIAKKSDDSESISMDEVVAKDDNYDKKLEIYSIIKGNQEAEAEIQEEKKPSLLSKLGSFNFKAKLINDNVEPDETEETLETAEPEVSEEKEPGIEVTETKEETEEVKVPVKKKISILEKLAAITVKDETINETEDTLEVKENLKEVTDESFKENIENDYSLLNFVSLVKDEPEEKENTEKEKINLNKVIDIIIVVLMIVLFIFLCMIVRQMF